MALVLRLAGEFQAFCRDLHDLTAAEMAQRASGGHAALRSILLVRFTDARQLDRGNAQPGSLGSDFGRFGIAGGRWPALSAIDRHTPHRQAKLSALNQMRNDVAHMNPGAVTGSRYAVRLGTIRAWDTAVSHLAVTMDRVTAQHLAVLFGVQEPW